MLGNEIFATSSNILFKGNLDDSKTINFEEFENVPGKILDLAITLSNIYIITVGDK